MKFGHLSVAYDNLCQDELDDFGYFPEAQEDHERFFTFAFPEIMLFHPLEQAGLHFRRARNFFSAYCRILARKEPVFKGLSKKLGARLEAKGYGWSEINKNLCGYVLNQTNLPVVSIIETQNLGEREIWVGSSGATAREFKMYEDFEEDLRELEKVTNLAIKTIISSPRVSERFRKSKKIPSHCIYINS